MASQAHNPIQRLIGIIDGMFGNEQPKSQPKFTLKAQLERSLIHEEICQNKAKLETFRAQEAEFRAILVAAYGSMAYEAERMKFKLETGAWKDGATLQTEYERVEAALDAHCECLAEIDATQRRIADAQSELDDAELWVGVL